nr:hypothetical protein GCM10020093_106720 [Planobispora longispora]
MIEVKSIDKPDERRDFPKGHLEVCNLTGLSFGVATFEPGWRWSESVKQIVGTDSCEVHHNGFVVQGRIHIRMNDGTETEVGPGRSSSARPDTTPGSSATSRSWPTTSRVAPRSTPRPRLRERARVPAG